MKQPHEYESELKQIISTLQNNKGDLEKHIRELAGLYGISLRALLSEGLTADQAIEILKARGPFII